VACRRGSVRELGRPVRLSARSRLYQLTGGTANG
jgi:hypothetical protein